MLTQKQRSTMRDLLPAAGHATACVWVRELLDHAEEMETEIAALRAFREAVRLQTPPAPESIRLRLARRKVDALAQVDAKPITHPRDTDAKGCFCCCNPYAEPNAERAPECPIHGSRADALTGEKP